MVYWAVDTSMLPLDFGHVQLKAGRLREAE